MQNVLGSLPYNISLLILSAEDVRGLTQIDVLDIFGNASKDFHPSGLFSVEAFGKVGEEKRNRHFAYIDLSVEIFHPTIYRSILQLKELYGKIMSGTAYAVFDPATKDFEPSTMEKGQTGFSFFLKHFHQIEFEQRPSTSRTFAIEMIRKYQKSLMMDKMVVMPAGLRDFVILDNGKPEEDEINGLYRRVISHSNLIRGIPKTGDLSQLDASRYALQTAVYEVYQYIVGLLEGKGKMIQGWWMNRNVIRSTRNVITAATSTETKLFGPRQMGPNHTIVGLFQTFAAMFPIAVNRIRGFGESVFPGPNSPAILVDKKTLQKKIVSIHPDSYDLWMTQQGVEKLLKHFEVEAFRHDEIMVEGNYFGLLYNDGKCVKFMQGIDDLPEGRDKKFVKPITYCELYYLALASDAAVTPVLNTRYPILGYGGIYPSYIYLRSTTKSIPVNKLDAEWNISDEILPEFPIRGQAFMNSMCVHPSHGARLDSDHDGDTMSLTAVLTDEGRAEIAELLHSSRYYVGMDGKMVFSASTSISDNVLLELTS